MTARTWWFTPNLDHIDAQAHPVALRDYKLVYLDTEGKPHPIVEGEGSLVYEYTIRTDYHGETTDYLHIDALGELRRLLAAERDRYSKSVTKRVVIGTTAGSIALAAAVADDVYPALGLVFLAGIGVSVGTTLINTLSIRTGRRLQEAIARVERDAYEAERDLEAKKY